MKNIHVLKTDKPSKILFDIDDAWARGWVQAYSDYRVKNK